MYKSIGIANCQSERARVIEPWLLPLNHGALASSSWHQYWQSSANKKLPESSGQAHGNLPTPPFTATILPLQPWVLNLHYYILSSFYLEGKKRHIISK